MKVVNLSRRPFANERPVVRLAIFLWIFGAVLLAVNIYSYVNYWIDSAEGRAELADLDQAISKANKAGRDLDARFAGLDLEDKNSRTEFLNQLIRDRTFPWSFLFEDLEEVLPFGAKLNSLQPELSEERRRGPRRRTQRRQDRRRNTRATTERAPAPPEAPAELKLEEVELDLQGTAKDEDALMELVSNLYDHTMFRDPFLSSESFNEATRSLIFNIKVTYLIQRPGAAEAEVPADETGEGMDETQSADSSGSTKAPSTAPATVPAAAGTPAVGTPIVGTPAAGRPAPGTPGPARPGPDLEEDLPAVESGEAPPARAFDSRSAESDPEERVVPTPQRRLPVRRDTGEPSRTLPGRTPTESARSRESEETTRPTASGVPGIRVPGVVRRPAPPPSATPGSPPPPPVVRRTTPPAVRRTTPPAVRRTTPSPPPPARTVPSPSRPSPPTAAPSPPPGGRPVFPNPSASGTARLRYPPGLPRSYRIARLTGGSGTGRIEQLEEMWR